MINLEDNKHLLYAVRIIFEKKEIDNLWESHHWVVNDLIPLNVTNGEGHPPINDVRIRPLVRDDLSKDDEILGGCFILLSTDTLELFMMSTPQEYLDKGVNYFLTNELYVFAWKQNIKYVNAGVLPVSYTHLTLPTKRIV